MNSKVKVSVVISAHNSLKYIEELLVSIFGQTIKVDEIVISENCIADGVLKRIETLNKDSQVEIKIVSDAIRISRFENMESALSCCSGDVILLADTKYGWEKNRVETVLHWFEINRGKALLFTDIAIVEPLSKKEISLFEKIGFDKKRLKKFKVDTFEYCEAFFSTIAMTKDFDFKLSHHIKDGICTDFGYLLILVAIDRCVIGCVNEKTVKFHANNCIHNLISYPNLTPHNIFADEYKPVYENLSILSLECVKKMQFGCSRRGFSGRQILSNAKRYREIYGNKNAMYCDLYRILKIRIKTFFKRPKIDSRYLYSKEKYASWIYDLKNNKTFFVPLTQNQYKRDLKDPKVFAFYLPQYHSIPENDDAHGKGFTEWTNVASCVPQFVGHYQPKVPYDVGFYDLTKPGVLERQVEIAKAYGIYGFCFYYYWFSGRKVLERPLEYFLKSDIDFRFHFCWANENWSKLWDGGDKELILEQKLMSDDADKFFDDILPFIKDKRYEKISNKPILVVYRPALFEKDKLKSFLGRLNTLAKNNGFDGFYILMSNAFGGRNPYDYDMEGLVEFPPHCVDCQELGVDRIDARANFLVYDMDSYIADKKYLYEPEFQLFKTCFPCWDNLPRKSYSKGRCFIMSDDSFESWLDGIIEWTRNNNSLDKQYVYINAWNEWGEGAILEPTTRYGYKYLDIVKRCIEKSREL